LANTVTLSPVRDTYTSLISPGTNYSTSFGLSVGKEYSSVITQSVYCAFVAFDLTSIPANKTITKLQLKLYASALYFGSDSVPGGSWSALGGKYPVVRARRVTNHTASELSSLTYSNVVAKSGADNPYDNPRDSRDTSFNIAYSAYSYFTLEMNDISRANECIFAVYQDPDYSLSARFIFGSQEQGTSYEPKLVVTYEDYIPPKPTELIPNESIRNKSGEIKLSWKFEDATMGTSQAAYQVDYSTNNFSTFTTVTGTTNNYRILQANLFTDGQTISWRVKVTDTNGDTTAFSDVASFTIGVTTPSVPEIINPVNTIVNSSDIIIFRWKFSDLYGYTQARYDLQYKKDADVETTVTETTVNNQYSLPASTLTGGNYSWRVRCYNAFNEVGPYSDWNAFYSIGQPANPEILSVSNSAKPTIEWHSTEQDLFEIKIYQSGNIIYDTGETPGYSASSYTIDTFLQDGNYVVGLIVSNVYGFWSSETLYSFTISTTKPTKPSMIGVVNSLYASLFITSGTSTNIIYRRGPSDIEFNQLVILTANSFQDYSIPAGDSQYFVRAVSETGFNDSDMITLTASFKGIVLSDGNDLSDYINLWETKDSDKRRNISLNKEQFSRRYNGRTYPINQSTEGRDHAEAYEYYIKANEYDQCYRILYSNTVLFRHGYGKSFSASTSGINFKEDEFGNYIVTFVLNRLEE
jgi:hypothetical protein